MCLLRSIVAIAITTVLVAPASANVFTADDLFRTKFATSSVLSPDGKWVAYTVSVARGIEDKAGARYAELHVVSTETGESKGFITGEVSVSAAKWHPQGSYLGFRMTRGDGAKRQVWAIPMSGGEAFAVTESKENVIEWNWAPDGTSVMYTALEAKSKRDKKLDKLGYGFKFYEEKLRHRNLYECDFSPGGGDANTRRITDSATVWAFQISPRGDQVIAQVSPKNLIDHRYAFSKLYMINPASGQMDLFVNNPGKLGSFQFSPDGSRVVYTAAKTQSDHSVSQVYIASTGDRESVNLTEPNFRGHVISAWFRDSNNIAYYSGEGVWRTMSTVRATGGDRKLVLSAEETGLGFLGTTWNEDASACAFIGTSNTVPSDVYYWPGKGKPKRLTNLNPWVEDEKLGRYEVHKYKARDGYELDGLLYYPVNYQKGQRYPLVVHVHGGPESHDYYSWRTNYSRPVQVLCGKGYAVFLPNYRSSTGYGLEHTEKHMGDAAGVEFEDIADAIDHFVKIGLADKDRIGVGGGSYGGYAAAWFATYYTKKVKAAVMFVGISNLISKRGTTDIPYEELYVHSGELLEEMWEESLKRSPLYYASKSKTATLIVGGTNDTRVHPAQSLELYRRMKMNDHPAVRLVQYPGEPHGNQKMPGRRDMCLRTLAWYDWYLKDGKPITSEMPPVDISDQYGISFDN